MHQPQRPSTRAKYLSIQKRMDELYNTHRLRYDDCIQKIMQEYFIEHQVTVMRILGTKVTPEPADPNQLRMFDDV